MAMSTHLNHKMDSLLCMSKSLPDRIAQVMDELAINQSEVARLAGVTRGRVNQWINGKPGGMSAEAAFRLADRTPFEARWLATGDGPERKVSAFNHRTPDLIEYFRQCDERGRATIMTVAEREASYNTDVG